MNLAKTRLRGRVAGKIHNREKWKKLLRTAKESSHSAHGNGMNERTNELMNELLELI
jgi:hypothetical protein